MSLDKKTLKKIESDKESLLLRLKKAEDSLVQLESETDEKKAQKLRKKYKSHTEMIVYYGDKIGNLGGSLDGMDNDLSDKQLEILKEIFPYGFNKESIEMQKKRNQTINSYKDWIKKIRRMRETYPAYDTDMPVREKLKNKIYKEEKEMGWLMLARSNPNQKAYDPEWNYEEHFATSTEFTEEEREIMEYCYKVGLEYDAYFDERYGFIADIGKHISDTAGNMYEGSQRNLARKWAEHLRTDVFILYIKYMNRGEKLSKKEIEAESIEMTKRFIEFIRDREALEEYLDKWNELKSSDRLNGYNDNKKNTIVLRSLMSVIGEEKALFTYSYTQLPETEQGIERLLKYTYEELGLGE